MSTAFKHYLLKLKRTVVSLLNCNNIHVIAFLQTKHRLQLFKTIVKCFIFLSTERDLCVAQGLFCDENAHCEEGGVQAKCVCNEGYVGDGITCRTVGKSLLTAP